MSLGLCCEWMETVTTPTGKQYEKNIFNQKSIQLGQWKANKYSVEYVHDVYAHNVSMVLSTLQKVHDSGISVFRISSSLFPLFDVVPQETWDHELIRNKLKKIGEFVIAKNMRMTTHPGQFCVLSSDSQNVIGNSVRELSMHGWLFDQMGFDHSSFYAINIHGGKSDRLEKLVSTINSLPDNVRTRLTLENDESCYSVSDLKLVHSRTNTPIIFDSHHHTFNTGNLERAQAFQEAVKTWNNIKPLQHISNTREEFVNGNRTERRKHSDYIKTIPKCQYDSLLANEIDVEVEAKAKQRAIFDLSKKFGVVV